MVRIDPCHGSDPGSIPGSFVFIFFPFFFCREPVMNFFLLRTNYFFACRLVRAD